MADYKEIHGVNLQKLDSNPSIGNTPGDIWYNTTLGEFKVIRGFVTGGAWATGGNLATARYGLGGAGTQTAALGFGGNDETYNPFNLTEEYDGSAWTAGGNLATARTELAGAGTQTAGLAVGGFEGFGTFYFSRSSEEYDGSTWTAGGNLIANANSVDPGDPEISGGISRLSCVGTQTAALGFGGYDSLFSINLTQEYDGSTWTAGGNMVEAAERRGGAGTQTAGLSFGGYDRDTGVTKNTTEQYDGSVWTAGVNLATARSDLAGAGTQTAGLGFGGYTATNPTAATEEYQGPGLYTETITST